MDNYKVRIQFEIGNAASEYQRYTEPQIVTANADGTVTGIISISPITTICSDTDNVNINMTYKADTKLYIDGKFAELQALVLSV